MKFLVMRRVIYFLFLLFISFKGYSQEPFYSQFFSSPLQLNPSYAGTMGCSRVVLSARNQFPSQPQSYQRVHLGYDQYVPFLRAGIGANFLYRYRADEGEHTTQIGYIHSQHFQLGETFVLKPALELVYRNRRLDNRFEGYQDVNVFDVNGSMLLYSRSFFAGFALYHMGEPKESYYPITVREPREFVTRSHLGLNFYRGEQEEFTFSPGFIFHNELDLQITWFTFAFSYKNYTLGVAYTDLDAIIFQGRYARGNFSVGYSYDLSVQRVFFAHYSAHELTLNVLFNCKNKRGEIIHPNIKGF
jgi:type IX secretion system PorP/SprF family membrane protein